MEKTELDKVTTATALGVQQAIGDPETWAVGFKAFSEYAAKAAQREAGGYVLGWLRWVIGKLAAGLLVLLIVYLTGGLPAVLAYLKVKS